MKFISVLNILVYVIRVYLSKYINFFKTMLFLNQLYLCKTQLSLIMSKQKFNRIKIVLVENDKSAIWLAKQLGKNKSTVSRWCTNDMQPSLETLYSIAEILSVEVRELLVPSTEDSKH